MNSEHSKERHQDLVQQFAKIKQPVLTSLFETKNSKFINNLYTNVFHEPNDAKGANEVCSVDGPSVMQLEKTPIQQCSRLSIKRNGQSRESSITNKNKIKKKERLQKILKAANIYQDLKIENKEELQTVILKKKNNTPFRFDNQHSKSKRTPITGYENVVTSKQVPQSLKAYLPSSLPRQLYSENHFASEETLNIKTRTLKKPSSLQVKEKINKVPSVRNLK